VLQNQQSPYLDFQELRVLVLQLVLVLELVQVLVLVHHHPIVL
jgi:hypothetical protein